MTMKNNEQFSPLSLMMMPTDESSYIYNNEFFLADNIEQLDKGTSISQDIEASHLVTWSYPFKMEFTMSLICLQGSMHVRLNLEEYVLGVNDVLVVTTGAIGECLDISEDCKVVMIAFSDDYFIPKANSQTMIPMMKFFVKKSLLHLTDEQMADTMEMYRRMCRRVRQADFQYKREMLSSCIQMLFYEVCDIIKPELEKMESEPGTRKKQIFDNFMDLLKKHYTTERSIEFYADKMCITPKYLSHIVYTVSGRHAGDWIRDYVILEAKALLKTHQYTIQQVADLLNFPNQSFFGTYFKRATSLSPKAYQNS